LRADTWETPMDDLVILYTTWPDAETATACARAAVEAKLAACANLLAPMQSIYRWEGQVQSETETPLLLKTTRAAAERLRVFVAEYHPYDTPCVVGFQTLAVACNPEYVAWANNEIE
jgi:periplasmic divalent cation tolerance protein